MTDSVLVFPPGFRVTDANDEPVNNAKIKFREVGPGATKEVFSDASLSTSLGHTVRTRSDGFPVVSEGSNTTVLIYIDAGLYYIEITDADDVAIFPAKDNVQGAVDTSTFLTTGSTSTLDIAVISKTGDYTVLQADNGKAIDCNPSGGFFTITLPNAVTVGDGWNILIRNTDSANPVGIAASQNISTQVGDVTAVALRPGQSAWIVSNGATFKMIATGEPRPGGTVGRIEIADRLSTPPGSPVAGARYIVTSSPTGAWAAFAEHSIAESNGQSGWLQIVPPTDCGWVAYVQDEDARYIFKGSAWVKLGGSALQVFTGSGTYTPTPGMTNCLVISTGGGGGSGGVDSDGSSSAGSGGGGAGGTCIEMFTAATIGASQTVTIGAGGAAGAVTGGDGGAGGSTTFGALHTATGGGGGPGNNATTTPSIAAGGAGGVPTGGAINITGGDGHHSLSEVAGNASGGHGGASFWGGGGKAAVAITAVTAVGTAGAAYGAGGGGSINTNDTNGVLGAVGAGGVVVVVEFF